jgi:phosphate transport system protein
MPSTPRKPHTDREYEAELGRVRENLLRMAGCVEDMISSAVRALTEGDIDLAQRTIQTDRAVNALEVETDELCLLLLARRQPLASDLRMITLAMKMVTDLERIGDLAVNICERVLALGKPPAPAVAARIARMAELAQEMIRRSIDAFIDRDAPAARAVFALDQGVDALYRDLTDGVQVSMHHDRAYVQQGIHLNAVAKFLERIGDHATNLAELVIFLVDGKDVRHKAERFDGGA